MANWKDIASAGKSVGKLDKLDVSENTKVTMEAIMCAMAASGKVQEMGLIAQTIEKVDTQVDLKQIASDLGTVVAAMKAKEVPAKPDEESVTLTKAQFEDLKAQLSGK
jgi:hypothetical protein